MTDKPNCLIGWLDQLCNSKVQILIRIAIFAMGEFCSISADERFNWLLENVDIFNVWYHHEVFSFLQKNYRSATNPIRKQLVTLISSYRIIGENDVQNKEVALRTKFEFLSWLLLDAPNCAYARDAHAPILSKYPDWQLSEHPDYNIWMGSVRQLGTQSPYSLNELLKMTASECIAACINFPSDHFIEPSRTGLFTEIQRACETDPKWACEIADELIIQNLWDIDFWYAIIGSFLTSNWEQSIWVKIFQYIRIDNVFNLDNLFYTIADLLLSIVKNGGKSFLPNIIHETDEIALKLWNTDKINYQTSSDFDFFTQALNHPAGKIAEYWIACISISNKGLERDEQTIPNKYQSLLEDALKHGDNKSAFLRSIMMFHADYLYNIDMNWTKTKLLTLLQSKDIVIFRQAWDGFLYCLMNNLFVFLELHKELIYACRKISAFEESRNRFVELIAYFIIYSKIKPVSELMRVFYENSSEEDRITFLNTIRIYIQKANTNSLEVFWQNWLDEYLSCRLDNIYHSLSSREIIEIFNWLPYLPVHFPELVKYISETEPIEKLEFHFLYDLTDIPQIKKHPTEAAQLIVFLCRNSLYLFQETAITKLAQDISDSISVELMTTMKEALISRNILLD